MFISYPNIHLNLHFSDHKGCSTPSEKAGYIYIGIVTLCYLAMLTALLCAFAYYFCMY